VLGGAEAFDKPGPYTYIWGPVNETLTGKYSYCSLSTGGFSYIVTYDIDNEYYGTAVLAFNKNGDFVGGTVASYGIEGERTSDSFDSMDILGTEHGLLTKWPL
jgi:hypothetical protein